jgi:hypothetical protein
MEEDPAARQILVSVAQPLASVRNASGRIRVADHGAGLAVKLRLVSTRMSSGKS